MEIGFDAREMSVRDEMGLATTSVAPYDWWEIAGKHSGFPLDWTPTAS